jgi:hypothetical protein
LLWIVPAVLALELSVNGLDAQLAGPPPVDRALLPKGPLPVAPAYRRPPAAPPGAPGPINTLDAPTIRASEFVRPTPIARLLHAADGGRFVTLDRIVWDPRGYHIAQRRSRWGRLGMQQAMIFGLQEAQGYNPTQLRRYWSFVRAVERKPIRYNAAFFIDPPRIVRDLLQIQWVIVSKRRHPPFPGAAAVRSDGDWELFKLLDAPPRVSLAQSWTYVRSADSALRAILAPGFDPPNEAVIEAPAPPDARGEPARYAVISSDGSNYVGTAVYRSTGPQDIRVDVDAMIDVPLLIRNAYDPGWRATIDGRPTRVWPGDYLDQAVFVPAGKHRLLLRYEDPSIGAGLLGTSVSIAGLLIASLLLRRRR